MIDSKTDKRIIIQINEKYGPYVTISNYDDAGAFEDVLDDYYHVLYWKMTPDHVAALGGNEYYFGNAADPIKLQAILDEITFD